MMIRIGFGHGPGSVANGLACGHATGPLPRGRGRISLVRRTPLLLLVLGTLGCGGGGSGASASGNANYHATTGTTAMSVEGASSEDGWSERLNQLAVYRTLSKLYAQAERDENHGRLDEARRAYQDIIDVGEGTVWLDRASERLSQLEEYRTFSNLYVRAERDELFGRLDDARHVYQEIVDTGEGTDWPNRARERLSRLETYQRESERLRQMGKKASDRNDFTEAFLRYQQLLLRYPRSQAAKRTLLPVQINTVPPGAEVRTNQPVSLEDPVGKENPTQTTSPGRSPLVIWVDPIEVIEVTISLAGYQTQTLVIKYPKEHRITIPLSSAN